MIVALISQKGGVGKSTLAVSIGWELAARRNKVLIVDTDPQASARIASEVASESGMDGPTTTVLGKDLARPSQLPTLARGFDHVIVDTPGKLGDVTAPALKLADVALIPIGQSGVEAWGTSDTITVVRAAQESLNPNLRAALVFVRKVPNTSLGKNARSALTSAGLPIFRTETTFRVAWQEAMMAGQGVAHYAPKDKAATELRALVDELCTFATIDLRSVANG